MWKDEIKKYASKSKFWGDIETVPNELDRIVSTIVNMKGKQRSNQEVQDDIKYIKKLCKHQIKKLQGHLDKLNKIPMDGSDTDDEDLSFDGLGSLFS
tara:strand:+ start:104 stop:394 length:291 start_codon:yes stop_codon:yes gene_type:complete